MNWVFCNKCSLKYDPQVKYFLSECGHIFCAKCITLTGSAGYSKDCRICNKSVSVMELSQHMDNQAQMFFWPLENVMEHSLKIFNFQSMHRSLFAESLNRKYTYLKKQYMNLYVTNKKLQSENHHLKELFRSMGCNPLSVMTSTPLKADNCSSFDPSISMLSSIKPSQNHAPGSAQKLLLDRKLAHLEGGLNSTLSSVKDQSSCHVVLNPGHPAPVHRNPIMRNQTPPSAFNFMRKYRGTFQNSSAGIPRK